MTSDTDADTVTEQHVVQAPMDQNVELLLNGLDGVTDVTIDEYAEQGRGIDIYQFLVTIEHDGTVDIEDAIADIKYLTLIEERSQLAAGIANRL